MWWNCFPQSATFASSSPKRSSTHARCKSTMQPSSYAPGERTEAVLEKLPSAALWQRLYRDARSRGPVTLLSARITPAAIPVVVAFAKNTASAFERLMLGARAWKELAPPPRARVLLATQGLDGGQEHRGTRSVIGGVAGCDCADARHEIEGREALRTGCFHIAQRRLATRCLANGRHRSRQSRRALAHRAATECARHAAATGKRCAISHAVKAGSSTSSTRQRCGGGAPARFSPCRAPMSSATPASCGFATARRSGARRDASHSSARASVSTPAASTSRPTRACTTCTRTCRAAPWQSARCSR